MNGNCIHRDSEAEHHSGNVIFLLYPVRGQGGSRNHRHMSFYRLLGTDTAFPVFIWQSGRRVKISVHWKVWRKTENLPGFRRHLSKKVPYSAVSALPDLSCLPLFYWNMERNYQEMRFGNIWQEISAAAQVMRTL